MPKIFFLSFLKKVSFLSLSLSFGALGPSGLYTIVVQAARLVNRASVTRCHIVDVTRVPNLNRDRDIPDGIYWEKFASPGASSMIGLIASHEASLARLKGLLYER